MRRTINRNILASAARTTSSNTPTFTIPRGANIRLLLAVTAVSGTSPSLTVSLQGQTEPGNWVDLTSIAAFTAVGNATALIQVAPRNCRITWTITGTTPSFTFDASIVIETQT